MCAPVGRRMDIGLFRRITFGHPLNQRKKFPHHGVTTNERPFRWFLNASQKKEPSSSRRDRLGPLGTYKVTELFASLAERWQAGFFFRRNTSVQLHLNCFTRPARHKSSNQTKRRSLLAKTYASTSRPRFFASHSVHLLGAFSSNITGHCIESAIISRDCGHTRCL